MGRKRYRDHHFEIQSLRYLFNHFKQILTAFGQILLVYYLADAIYCFLFSFLTFVSFIFERLYLAL